MMMILQIPNLRSNRGRGKSHLYCWFTKRLRRFKKRAAKRLMVKLVARNDGGPNKNCPAEGPLLGYSRSIKIPLASLVHGSIRAANENPSLCPMKNHAFQGRESSTISGQTSCIWDFSLSCELINKSLVTPF